MEGGSIRWYEALCLYLASIDLASEKLYDKPDSRLPYDGQA